MEKELVNQVKIKITNVDEYYKGLIMINQA